MDHYASAEYLGALCKIKLSEEEKKSLNKNLEKIFNYMVLLDEVDVEGVAPSTTVLETLHSVMGEDVEGFPFNKDLFFKNVPDHVGKMIKVPPVIEFE